MGGGSIFFMTVMVWGTTWIAIKQQSGLVAPEVSVAYRFLAAGLILLAWCLARRMPLRYSAGWHLRIAAQGLCMFCLNFILLYWASRTLTSGLVAVGFSTAVPMTIALNAVIHRKRIEPAALAGGAMGMAGLALAFWPEIQALGMGAQTLGAIGLILAAAGLASVGTALAGLNQKSGLPIVQTNALGMTYGGLACAAWVTVSQTPWTWEPTTAYAVSLGYLVVFGSIVGFWGYMTTVGRMGPERAAYIAVLFPVVALCVSSLVEGYAWTPLSGAGIALVVAGNVVMMGGGRLPRIADRAVARFARLG